MAAAAWSCVEKMLQLDQVTFDGQESFNPFKLETYLSTQMRQCLYQDSSLDGYQYYQFCARHRTSETYSCASTLLS